MWFEDLLVLLLVFSILFLIGIPFYKFMAAILPKRRASLMEAKERLEQARIDAEAARLNKEAELLYTRMYEESLQDEEVQQKEKWENHK